MRKEGIKARLGADLKERGASAWLISVILISFYAVLYLGQPITEPHGALERLQAWLWPLTESMEHFTQRIFWWLRDQDGQPMSSRWTLYGALYTLAISIGGVAMLRKYRHDRYQVVRTLVVIFVQVSFAFSLPLLLKFFQQPEYYFSYFWPLKIEYLDPRSFDHFGPALVLFGFAASLIAVPVLTLLYGKRWYCSWVCGCGGLANTAGEPWRHLSNPSKLAWRIEQVTIHTVMVIAVISTVIWFASAWAPAHAELGAAATFTRKWYGLIVVASLSGVIGTGLYPIGGTRIWCRFACPMAAMLGLIQKLGRFRIRVKPDMCISCGRCTKYCEMGIDVRAYAQANQDFTRASCVGCGLCAHVCPRGVLRLENVSLGDHSGLRGLTLSSFLDESWKSGT